LFRQVDGLCDRSDRAWRIGERPCLADYLATAPAEAQAALRWELLRVELWNRRRFGEEPTLAEYRQRFPDEVELPGLLES
jgi:hypothetical protein